MEFSFGFVQLWKGSLRYSMLLKTVGCLYLSLALDLANRVRVQARDKDGLDLKHCKID